MMDESGPARWTFRCHDVGFACEWGVIAPSPGEVERRFRDHAGCAHALAELSPEWTRRVAAASRAG